MKNNNPANFWRNQIYTLAQSGTENYAKLAVILRGKGSEISPENFGMKKGKKKIITQSMVLHLIDIAKEKGRDVKPFWNTYYCMSRVTSHAGKIYGNYCKNRFCTNCTAIRKAEKINAYYPVLKKWEQPYFVTLTVKACKHYRLKPIMEGCIRALKMITDKYRKRNQRGYDSLLVGIRSLECNFNPTKNTYNPHLHILVQNEEMAKMLIKDWLGIWNRKGTRNAAMAAQDYRLIWNLESALIETIKYGSKIFTEPKTTDEANGKASPMVYARAYFNIIDAMKGLRIFERFGFNLPKNKKEITPAFITTDFNEWIFLPEYHDWHNVDNELTLTGYTPECELVELLDNNIDKEKE